MKKPIVNISESVLRKLLNLSREIGENYNALLTQYVIERFLYRLSRSNASDSFVLKGAMLFRVWTSSLHRPTKDVDLLGYCDPSPISVATLLQEIMTINVLDDGVRYDTDSITVTEIREEEEHGGVRVKLLSFIGTARIPMQIDIGFGDLVYPKPKLLDYPTLLEMEGPKLRMYPVETVVAEKVEAVISRGMLNSRVKDYYDLYVLFRDYPFDDKVLRKAMVSTFKGRKIAFPKSLPIGLSNEFAKNEMLKTLWKGLLRRLEIIDVPDDFSVVVRAIRNRVWQIISEAKSRKK
ncbi:MAG: nucleotidyl transferase AbiEii/AbiGii toxin family protein [Planctomycetes bacterium]|nr:nucleotidyl transferase AbiEii/AbiGii toxin family protein [Planctomycetota bacterium]